jgi:chromosome segregation ATPase
MKKDTDKPDIKAEARELRKKVKRIEESRSSVKAKSRKKGKTIKTQQDRQKELEQNRDDWKAKCKKEEKERIETDEKYKQVATRLEMKEEELRKITEEFEGFKKKILLAKKRQ